MVAEEKPAEDSAKTVGPTPTKERSAKKKVTQKKPAKAQTKKSPKKTTKSKAAKKTGDGKSAQEAEAKSPGRRGRPNPYEEQIQLAISRFEQGNTSPVAISFKTVEEADAKKTNLYQAFRNRGFKVSVDGDGSALKLVIAGKAGKKAGKKGGKSRKVAGEAIIVRTPVGRGWRYQEFASAEEAKTFIGDLSGKFGVFKELSVEQREVKRTETVLVGL